MPNLNTKPVDAEGKLLIPRVIVLNTYPIPT